MKPSRSQYATTFHKDGTITAWCVYTQQWVRTGNPSDRMLASLPAAERDRAIRHCASNDECDDGQESGS